MIADFIDEKGITEVVHFTTNHGVLSILASHQVLSRLRVDDDELTREVQLPVWAVRRDTSWTDYINLSITEMSRRMFATSRQRHGDDVWWAVFSFSPEILTHPGVWFTTTNNTYVGTVRRGEGFEALEDLWSEPIPWGWHGSQSTRYSSLPDNRPTNEQAEVLYPGALPLNYLQAIYVREEEHIDEIEGWKATTGNAAIPVICKPGAFK